MIQYSCSLFIVKQREVAAFICKFN
jgi:hypothetical protein